MSQRESTSVSTPQKPRRSRMRRFFTRHLPLGAGGAAVLLAAALVGLYLWACSPQCEHLLRRWLIVQAEAVTGGRVEIASFTWCPLRLEADAGGITIHGLEGRGEAPYAHIASLRVHLSVLGFLSPKVLLNDLEISEPRLHIIVYPDGRTNQPRPRPRKLHASAMETLFDVKAGHITIEDGVLDYDDRAAAFDFQNRNAPLNLNADDASLLMRYVPAAKDAPGHYRIEAGVTDLDLTRGARPSRAETAHGRMQAVLDLTRTGANLRSLHVTSGDDNHATTSLEISGTLQDFAHPRWQGQAAGDLDMTLLDPTTGYPFAPEGIAHVNLSGAGAGGEFRVDGSVSVVNGAYDGPGVNAAGVQLNAHLHADANELAITSIAAHLRQGGEIDGAVVLNHWLPPVPGAASLEAAQPAASRLRARNRRAAVAKPQPPVIPVDGKVTARLKSVALDTILAIVSQPPFQRLGFNALVSGPASATWSHGDAQTTVVSATLALDAGAQTQAGENPAVGNIDATYSQRDGSVDLRNLDVKTPGNHLQAQGRIGAYPIRSPSAIAVDLESSSLGEFNTLLQSLGLHHDGKSGIAAIPVSLHGQAAFHGSWTGSLADPHITGELRATQLVLRLPPPGDNPLAQPRLLHLDSADVNGSYSAMRIAASKALLAEGESRIVLSGSLEAPAGQRLEFGANSNLKANLQAEDVPIDQLQPFFGKNLPVSGALDAKLAISGPLHAPGGSGWVQLQGGSIFGEPFKHARIEGTLEGRALNLHAVNISGPAGGISALGSYDLSSRRFQFEASSPGIEIARIARLRRQGLDAAGTLRFKLSGSGTPDDPHFQGQANLSALALGGQRLGTLQLSAHTVKHALIYDGSTRMVGADLLLHGQTALGGTYSTNTSLSFSQFNVAALLKMAHVEGLTADSSLAGTVTVDGPLAHPGQLRGEVRLRELAVTLASVHLKSEGGLHAILVGNRITLDPLHVTGEDTDMHAQGQLDLSGRRRLDLAAQGSINLKLAQTLDPDLSAAGTTSFQVEAHGPVNDPRLQGRIDFQDCSLSLGDLPNGLSQLHGSLVFNQNRLEVKTLTAMSGGGLLSVSGYLAYQHGIFADLRVSGQGIRIRYPQGISSLADANLHLEGPQNNLLLSGNVLITRFTVSPTLDIATLAAQANAAVETIAPPEAPSNHIRLDVHVASSPQLNFQNAYAKLAGDVDLHLRGTVANPSLLGRVSITEGAATIAGTRYELERGEVTFTNPVRIEPNIDLTATARVSDYDVTLDVHGTPARLTINPRSDPPLPEADVISLLALGHTQNQERLYTAQQEQALASPTTDAILGGALNATVSSRIQKLFGAGSVKIDPNYLGALGNSTSRITVQEQFGRNVTFTYATDVDTTGQQLLQAEIAVNRHVSLLVARDESGVFSVVIKATRRYR